MINDGLMSPSLAKKLKHKIDHRVALIEATAREMCAIVTDTGINAEVDLRGIRSTAGQLKAVIDRRTRKPKT